MLIQLIVSFIALNISHFLFSMNMEKIPDEVVIRIISKPDFQALEDVFALQIQNNKSNLTKQIIPYKQTRDALIPAFNVLATCRKYNSFKTQVKNIIVEGYFPQGIMLFLLPKSLQIKVFEQIPSEIQAHQLHAVSLFQKESIIKELINLCMKNNVCHTSLLAAVQSLNNCNDIIYNKLTSLKEIPYNHNHNSFEPYTLIEYLYNIFLLEVARSNQNNQSSNQSFKNFFTVIDNLCSLNKIDLALPGVIHPHESIETYICDKYQMASSAQKPEDLACLPLLRLGTSVKSMYERSSEYQHIVNTLIDFCLFANPPQ